MQTKKILPDMAKSNEIEQNSINIIGIGTDIKGDINSNGDIRIDGSLTGNLFTRGKVVIGETGKICGEIKCKNSDIAGELEGKIFVAELLSLKATARVLGDIQASRLSIEPGCRFTGFCNMNGNIGSDGEKGQTGGGEESGR
jgi:cytoskeletal protein CcmA (bactofilin family)